MVHGWAAAEELSNKVLETGSIYVRLANDGDKAVGVFCGEPFARSVHWTGVSYDECSGSGCGLCDESKKAVLRVACNFYVLAEDSMKIIEGGNRWFGDVLKVRKKYGLTDWAFEIERHGAANSTKTTYTILPDGRLDPSQRQRIASCELHDLSQTAAAAASASYSGDSGAAVAAGQRVSLAEAKDLHERLRTLAPADVSAFFLKFGVQRVSEVRVCDLEHARAFIAASEELPF